MSATVTKNECTAVPDVTQPPWSFRSANVSGERDADLQSPGRILVLS